MEYSDLVQAIQEDDSTRINELMKTLLPRLIRFLRVHMNASSPDAKDCAQEAMLICLESIGRGGLRNPDHVLSFLLSTCRNTYLKMQDKKRFHVYEELPKDHYEKPGQLLALLDKEKNKILEWCLNQLNKDFKDFIRYWIRHPESDAEKVADHFGLTISNTWTRKHRIIKQLNKCYQKKSKL